MMKASEHLCTMFGANTPSRTYHSLEMIAEFNAPPETPLNDPPTKFVPLVDQSPQVIDQSL